MWCHEEEGTQLPLSAAGGQSNAHVATFIPFISNTIQVQIVMYFCWLFNQKIVSQYFKKVNTYLPLHLSSFCHWQENKQCNFPNKKTSGFLFEGQTKTVEIKGLFSLQLFRLTALFSLFFLNTFYSLNLNKSCLVQSGISNVKIKMLQKVISLQTSQRYLPDVLGLWFNFCLLVFSGMKFKALLRMKNSRGHPHKGGQPLNQSWGWYH